MNNWDELIINDTRAYDFNNFQIHSEKNYLLVYQVSKCDSISEWQCRIVSSFLKWKVNQQSDVMPFCSEHLKSEICFRYHLRKYFNWKKNQFQGSVNRYFNTFLLVEVFVSWEELFLNRFIILLLSLLFTVCWEIGTDLLNSAIRFSCLQETCKEFIILNCTIYFTNFLNLL